MREKELRLALVCYGGISLAVYMHGITKEVWRLACASEAFHSGRAPGAGSQAIYQRLLATIARECGIELRVLVDILAGASAGGINAVFLADAIGSGRSLEPLTELWLEAADVDRLIDPEVSTVSRWAKTAAVPIAWMLGGNKAEVDETVDPGHRGEVRAKLASFVRARWFSPPFGGRRFTDLLLDAFAAMAAGDRGPALLPSYQPLDLFVTVTDFHGHPERLRLHSPAEVIEIEHRLMLAFRDPGGAERTVGHSAELVFAARATASFPGAFPPFQVSELDAALAARGLAWPGRGEFLERQFPRHAAVGEAEGIILIDGSVLANAPFRPAIDSLQSRPARREIDRRFVYIDPKPGLRSVRLTGDGAGGVPGFFATIFGALSDIPREQPIRDNLDAIFGRSARIRRLRHIVDAMRPEVEAAIERAFGNTFFLSRPTPDRLASWRQRSQEVAARGAGFAFAAYGHLKVAAIVEEVVHLLVLLGGADARARRTQIREHVWAETRRQGMTASDAMTGSGTRPEVIAFFRKFDLSFRTRRLRYLALRLADLDGGTASRERIDETREAVFDLIGRYRVGIEAANTEPLAADPIADPAGALEALAARLDLKRSDTEAAARLAELFAAMPPAERRALILTSLGFPFFDIATLPLLGGEGLDEFHPIKVDRISPDDCSALRSGGAEATLKGIQFHSFGAFFSRAYRENDYLWGRLHGAERLIDIVVSALPGGMHLPAGSVAELKRDAFRAILAEERPRLATIAPLFAELEREVG